MGKNPSLYNNWGSQDSPRYSGVSLPVLDLQHPWQISYHINLNPLHDILSYFRMIRFSIVLPFTTRYENIYESVSFTYDYSGDSNSGG